MADGEAIGRTDGEDAGRADEGGSGKRDGIFGYVAKDTVAQLFGLSGRRIEQLVADGVIERVRIEGGGVRFELAPTIQRYVKHLSDKAYGKERSEEEARLKEQKLRAEVALKESQGELHRLRTEIASGNYISVEEARADYSRFFIVFKNFALAIPGKMAGRLSGYADPAEVREIEGDLQKEVRRLLRDFVSRAVPAPDADGSAPGKGAVRGRQEDALRPKRRGRPRKNAGA